MPNINSTGRTVTVGGTRVPPDAEFPTDAGGLGIGNLVGRPAGWRDDPLRIVRVGLVLNLSSFGEFADVEWEDGASSTEDAYKLVGLGPGSEEQRARTAGARAAHARVRQQADARVERYNRSVAGRHAAWRLDPTKD